MNGAVLAIQAVQRIVIPSTVKRISDSAFASNYLLEEVEFAAGSQLEVIGQNAFADCRMLKTIIIPASVKSSTPSTSDSNTFTDDSGDKAADVQVIANPNAIPKEAKFSVRLDDRNTTNTRVAYDLSFTYNGANYEPADTVTVKIPVPSAMSDNAANLKVYHLQDGKYVNMNAKVEGGYPVFDTDHISIYVVTAENLTDTGYVENPESASASAPVSPSNPNTGIAAAAVPVLIAASAAVIIVSKKKK